MTDTATPATTTTATASPGALTTTSTVKAGWRTTEFWLTVAVQIVGALTTGDILAPGSTPAKVAAAVMMCLSALGYQYSRTQVKL